MAIIANGPVASVLENRTAITRYGAAQYVEPSMSVKRNVTTPEGQAR
jgi:hypothetical protein